MAGAAAGVSISISISTAARSLLRRRRSYTSASTLRPPPFAFRSRSITPTPRPPPLPLPLRVCSKATQPGNKNRRRNTSILIRHVTASATSNILVDAGKLRRLDAVLITHSHADAIGGLDDLRDWTNNVQPHIPIYVAQRDFEVMQKTHYYLVDTSVVLPGAAVSELQFNIIKEEPFTVHNLKVTPLPVWHGPGYRSLGFRFGDVCYISDASEIPEETYELMYNCDLLVLDALRPDRSSTTHFGLPKALVEVRKIKPKRTLFTGMMHLMDHDKINEDLLKLKETEGLDIQLSYDGLRVPNSTFFFFFTNKGCICSKLSARMLISPSHSSYTYIPFLSIQVHFFATATNVILLIIKLNAI
ncbi:Metallo-hydrolase/oxidoreductase superfamily protein [Rhynchospora pubera]|uniref:Metallo-hydrolase/oxidoreductase superfamily protein n=1 Tax=Rhynchospora pubera TaxID=906938 RepID=A0AAV8HZC7_9POAL|nr:Metallo-hydrolase/oxidoreductase superfamily protein [Rhynchospora pubera]